MSTCCPTIARIFGGSLARQLGLMNAGVITGLTTLVVILHLSVYHELAVDRAHERATHLAGTVADFATSYVADLRIGELNVVLRNLARTDEVTDAYVVDASGAILADASGDAERLLSDGSDTFVDRVIATAAPYTEITETGLEVGYPIRFSSVEMGVVRLTLAMDTAMAEAGEARRSTLVVAFLVLLLSLPSSVMLIRRLTGPIETLSEHTKAVAEGDLQTKVAVEGHGELGELAHAFNVMLDALHEKTERTRAMAFQDSMTGLANRARLNEVLAAEMPRATAETPLVVHLLDLDGFKQVNDTLGHEAGDELLTLVARRLENAVDDVTAMRDWAPGTSVRLLARLGGDEFVCVVGGADAVALAGALSDEILRTIRREFTLEVGEARIGTSIGSAVAPDQATTASELLRQADLRMYEFKRRHKPTGRRAEDSRHAIPLDNRHSSSETKETATENST